MIEALEAQRLGIQTQLDGKKTADERNKMGQFATPSPLARDVLTHAKTLLSPNEGVRFLDPALGSGAFYAALLGVFGRDQVQDALAFEIDPHYGDAAETLWVEHGLELVHGDFTRA